MKILALDLATITGWAYCSGDEHASGTWNVAAKIATKTRAAEPSYFRLINLFNSLNLFARTHDRPDIVSIEEAQGFTRYQAAVESSHQYRAIALFWAAMNGCRVITCNPNDLLFFALGKRACKSDEKKREMVRHAQEKYGYDGASHDEAEAIILLQWTKQYYGKETYEPENPMLNVI
jgi:hypothetical protein